MDIYIGVFLKKRRYFCGNSDKPFLSEKTLVNQATYLNNMLF